MARVVVGLSGGVDSSVAAYLLKEQGYDVVGLYMRNWEEADGECPATLDYEDVVRVADRLGIPHYSVNFTQQYWDGVFETFLDQLRKGLTPNPDILCNREIKFKVLWEHARKLGGEFLATGHYCRVGRHQGRPALLKGLDPGKDQSYFLHAIDGSVLEHVLFPVGEIEKSEVRRIAKELELATAEKKDSTGICFIGKRDFKSFVSQYISYEKGKMCRLSGEVVGEHDGVAYYTLGQRKGLGIGGEGEAWFVVAKDVEKNILYVEQGANHPALFKETLVGVDATWIGDAPAAGMRCAAKVRYRQPDQACVIEKMEGERVWVRFDEPQRAVTPGQSVVFYDGEVCLGGAVIAG